MPSAENSSETQILCRMFLIKIKNAILISKHSFVILFLWINVNITVGDVHILVVVVKTLSCLWPRMQRQQLEK